MIGGFTHMMTAVTVGVLLSACGNDVTMVEQRPERRHAPIRQRGAGALVRAWPQ